MPGVLRYTPAWLSRPSPGFDLFSSPPRKPVSDDTKDVPGPKRTIACRGTEIFVAVGSELRWSDLVLLRDNWEAHHRPTHVPRSNSIIDERANETAYRVIKVPIARKIKQLVISPNGDYIAILTSHTIHVARLPNPTHLNSEDTSPLKLRTFQVGPTAHVLERSPITSAIWHPLGANGTCLVTVTVDAIVRVWELDMENRWSFDSPSTAVDLKKLANGAISTEDFSPSKYGTSKGFSPDSFEMEVASACFGGGFGARAKEGWGSMTLWIAMREGDLYALCPFLPSKFTLPSSTSSKISAAIACEFASEEGINDSTEEDQRKLKDQTTWISDILEQTKITSSILKRPMRPGPVPMLQGPFQVSPDADQVFDITDLCVITPPLDERVEFDDEIFSQRTTSNPINLVCIATSEGKLQVCVDSEGVEGRWLPYKRSGNRQSKHDIDANPQLLLVESVVISESPGACWPMLSANPQSSSSIFITHENGVSHANFSAWSEMLNNELENYTEPGIQVRTDVILASTATELEHPIRLRPVTSTDDETPAFDIPACVSILDSDLGLFTLTSVDGEPWAVTLDQSSALEIYENRDEGGNDVMEDAMVPIHEPRPAYRPSKEFWTESKLEEFADEHPLNRGPRMMKEEIKFSPATLKLLVDIHRKLGQETNRLGQAAAELFRQCERLHVELRQQVKEVHTAATRIETVLGENEDDYDDEDDIVGTANKIEERMENARERQVTLENRFAELRRKFGRLKGRPINEKEKKWITDIRHMLGMLESKESNDPEVEPTQSTKGLLFGRLEGLKASQSQFLADVKGYDGEANGDDEADPNHGATGRLDELTAMIERQTALVDATRNKLYRLSKMST